MPALTSAPSLLPLYGKAALGARLHRGGSTLPGSVYTLADQSISDDQLAAYQRVCGFAVSDVLPPTYLHLLAFPLSMALMGERSFPFPVIGLVHVANTVSVLRRVHAGEPVSLRAAAADLRPHAAGTQFDLHASATVDGEEVWSSRSTYLRRGKSSSAEKSARRPSDATTATASSQVRAPEDIGRRYAAVSGDRNPIHLHRLWAKLFGFPSAIAHGMWLKARTLAWLQGRLPDAYDVEVAFKTPVLLPSTVSLVAAPTEDGWTLDVRDAKSGKPHLTGTVRAR